MPTTPGTPVEGCTHRVQHVHGSYLAYQRDRCRCEPCAKAGMRHHKSYRMNRNRGLAKTYTPTTQAREHIRALVDQGTPLAAIARQAGVPYNSLREIYRGEYPSADTNTVRAILATRHTPGGGLDRVGATGATRRVTALMAVGHSGVRIAEEAGVSAPVVHRLARGESTVAAASDAKIRAVYDRLWDKAPDETTPARARAARATRTLAAQNGWLVPAAYDDDRIDDPGYKPNVTAMRPTRADRVADYLDLTRTGVHPDEAARRAGYKDARSADAVARRTGHAA